MVRFRLFPVRRLLCDHLHVGVLVDDLMESARANARVRVGFLAEEFRILALLAHLLDELLGDALRALVVVRDDLADGDAARIDLAVDEERGNACITRLLHGGDRSVSTRIVADDGGSLVGDRVVEEFGLLRCIIVMRHSLDLVTKRLRLGGSSFRFRFEERVGVRRRDDVDDLRAAALQRLARLGIRSGLRVLCTAAGEHRRHEAQ